VISVRRCAEASKPRRGAIVPPREPRSGRRRRRGEVPIAGAASDAAPVARPVWSGSLSFGLVSVPVQLYSAQRASGVPLRMLGPDGTPLARQYVCPKHEKALEADEIVRGYEVSKGKFVVVTDDELEALAPRRSRDIDLQRFVARGEIDPAYFVRTYYLVPGSEQTKPYRLLAEILEQSGRAGIGTFVMRDKAYPVAIFADSGILRAETLRFGDELRSPESIGLPRSRKVEAARVRKLEKAIEALEKATLAEAELRDEEPARLLELAREKRERGEDVVEVPVDGAEPDDGEGGEVIDLMSLLKERLAGRGAGRTKRTAAKPAGRPRSGSPREKRQPRPRRRRRPAAARRG
jgi:DNA end-binding protein Ku